MKRLSLVFVVAFLAMFVAAGAAEEQPWCGEAEESGVDEPEMSAMEAICTQWDNKPACCMEWSNSQAAYCYQAYMAMAQQQCVEFLSDFCVKTQDYNYCMQMFYYIIEDCMQSAQYNGHLQCQSQVSGWYEYCMNN